jgi:hypothetical protein
MSDITPNQPTPFGSQPAGVPPFQMQPVPAGPHKSGMSATKVVLIVVACFVVLGAIVVGIIGAGAWYIVKSAHTDANGQVSMKLPFGSVRTIPFDQIAESDLGIAIYPGAEPGKSVVRTETVAFTQLSAFFFTTDSADKVIAFYKEKAGPDARLMTLPFGGTQFAVPGQAGTSIQVLITQGANATAGKTRIQITHTTPAAAAK